MILGIISVILGLTGTFLAGFGKPFSSRTAANKADLWGLGIENDSKIKKARRYEGMGWCIFGLSALITMFNMISYSDSWTMPWFTWISLPVSFIPIIPSTYLGASRVESILHEGNAVRKLAALPIIAEVDRAAANAKTINLRYDSIALYDSTGYCYFYVSYSDYGLGDIKNADKLNQLGYYFHEKYGGSYKRKQNSQSVYITYSANGNTQTQLIGTQLRSIFFVKE